MPVRTRIILLFSLLAFFILSIVCVSTYYSSYQNRINNIKKRLANRAVTTARLLSQREIFDEALIRRIDSSTTLTLTNKIVQAYTTAYRKIYDYRDRPTDTLFVTKDIINKGILYKQYYFVVGNKDALAFHYKQPGGEMIVITAGEDVDGKNNLESLLHILLISFMVGNIFVLVSAYIFSGRLLKPIKQINKDIADISAQNLTRRLTTGPAKDEWYELSSTINELLNRMQDSFELQRRFISNASHELSTPLTSISSQLEVSFQRKRNPEENEKIMHSIYQDVQQMIKLTQTLLEFAKASGNTGGLEIDLVRIDEIILELPAEVSRIDSSYSVSLQFENLPEEEEKLFVFGNKALLHTAIKNIVINACKYSDNNKANVLLEVGVREFRISIINKGAGIPSEEHESIFQPFYRMDQSRATKGFGLGLSMSHRIIKLHRGFIDLQSEPDKETVFVIRLPLAQSLQNV